MISTQFNWNKDTKFIVHGYKDSGFEPTLLQIKDSILKLVFKLID